jgi:hypothetical protein
MGGRVMKDNEKDSGPLIGVLLVLLLLVIMARA